MLKKICLLGAIALTASLCAFADPIQSYQELASALRAGNRFVIVLNLQQCTGNPGMPIGNFTPSALLLLPQKGSASERISTSHVQFTDYTGSPAYEYTKYTFNPDNTVVIRTISYDPLSFQPIGTARIINCELGNGVEIYSSN